MKKVLVLAAAIALFAAPAIAADVTNSLHNLASGTGNSYTGTSGEICVYCHTPHGGDSAGPLWNRSMSTTIANAYSSDTLTAAAVAQSWAGTDAPLCLSCHDGSSITNALNNAPNVAGQPTVAGAWQTTNGYMANLTNDMSNDHPVGFNYDAAQADAAESELVAAPGAPIQFFGSGNMMWCSSCHDVHDDSNGPFLLTSNAGSALCKSCHLK